MTNKKLSTVKIRVGDGKNRILSIVLFKRGHPKRGWAGKYKIDALISEGEESKKVGSTTLNVGYERGWSSTIDSTRRAVKRVLKEAQEAMEEAEEGESIQITDYDKVVMETFNKEASEAGQIITEYSRE